MAPRINSIETQLSSNRYHQARDSMKIKDLPKGKSHIRCVDESSVVKWDEKIELFGDQIQYPVWLKCNTSHHEVNTILTVKHGG